jgi:hypothetical protein
MNPYPPSPPSNNFKYYFMHIPDNNINDAMDIALDQTRTSARLSVSLLKSCTGNPTNLKFKLNKL